jgi:drug/metabolite transporter (DMT)-like permease
MGANRQPLIGAVLCATAITILGSSFALNRLILGYPTLTGQAARYLIAALVLACVLRAQRRGRRELTGREPTGRDLTRRDLTRRDLTRRDLLQLAALAATGLTGFNVCLLAALRSADPAAVGTVVGGTPLVLAVLGPLLRGARPAPRVMLAALVVVGGVALVEGGGHPTVTGVAWALGALAGEALFSILAAPLLPRLGAVRVSAGACLLAVPQLLLAAVVTGEWRRLRAPSVTETGALLYIALVLTVGAFLCWYGGLRRLGVERAGMFAGLLPVAALGGAALLDRTVPAPMQVTGVLVVGAGLALGLGTGQRARSAARTSSASASAARRSAASASSPAA